MFRKARIKLTTWYLLIIMFISVCFSVTMYEILTFELDRVERMQRLRTEQTWPEPQRLNPPGDLRSELTHPFRLDPDLIAETKNRLKIVLTLVNLIILGTSAMAGYFLAGRTLKPIKEMVDEQKRFVTDASHELRTPLTALKAEIEVNLRAQNWQPEEIKKLLQSNLEEVNNLQVLSDSLIKLTQYQKGSNGSILTKISAREITDEAIKKVTPLAKKKNITIVNKIEKQMFQGEKPAMVELMVIFLDNAIKYSPIHTKINLSSEIKKGDLYLRITDQGLGISKEDLPHLFDRFYRADKSRTKAHLPGYGLGLAIAKQIVDKHHGTITVESIFGKGTTFSIRLPLKNPEGLLPFSKLFLS